MSEHTSRVFARTEEDLVRLIGDKIGYGRTMQLCEEIWHKKEIDAGREKFSGAHTTGPCRAFMVKCEHAIRDAAGHCDICCGAGRITRGVSLLLAKSTPSNNINNGGGEC